jgi:hypothetical protein
MRGRQPVQYEHTGDGILPAHGEFNDLQPSDALLRAMRPFGNRVAPDDGKPATQIGLVH